MSEPITIKHWGGAAKLCDDCHLEKKGKRLVVHFAHGHWIEFLTKTGLMAGRRKADALDKDPDGGRLSTWRVERKELNRVLRKLGHTSALAPESLEGK